MNFSREINRLLLGLLIAFMLTGIAAAYWALSGEESLLLREDNPRRVEAEAAIRRGSLYDRAMTRLAYTHVNDSGQTQRIYDHPAAYSALGYFSLRYGVGGAEAAYDALLRGATLPRDAMTIFEQGVLHRPQHGSDLRLTFSLEVQEALARALGDHTGAAVVLAVPSGEVLALISQPTFDPNTLDSDWDALVAAPGKPFLNRVLQGVYQPGGMLQTPLLAAALLANQPLTTLTADAAVPLDLGATRLACALLPPTTDLDYYAAYAYACPRPFALLTRTLDQEQLQTVLAAFRLDDPPQLAGFVAPAVRPNPALTPTAAANPDPETAYLQAMLGQGQQTINPLTLAVIAAAVLNDGNAPLPYALLAVRPPDALDWAPETAVRVPLPMITATTARSLGEMMRQNTTRGAAMPAAHPTWTIGGHAALAYSGEGTHAWFVGFVQLTENEGAAVAVVLETSTDASAAARIGGDALAAAAAVLSAASGGA